MSVRVATATEMMATAAVPPMEKVHMPEAENVFKIVWGSEGQCLSCERR